nr:ABC transporter ATP-binding protein [Gephyromycinifex aptenodytis]
MITVEGVSFSYTAEPFLVDIDHSFSTGRMTAVLGPNGSGKSTLLRLLTGLLAPDAGTVRVQDLDPASCPPAQLARVQAYVAQQDEVRTDLSVSETILLGRHAHASWRLREGDYGLLGYLLGLLDIAHLAEQSVRSLSGGERQRVMIARALAQEPQVLLLDEPTSALDVRAQLAIMDLMRHLADDRGLTIIAVLHDLDLAARYADEVMLLDAGRIHRVGSPAEVITVPQVSAVYSVAMEALDYSAGRVLAPTYEPTDVEGGPPPQG